MSPHLACDLGRKPWNSEYVSQLDEWTKKVRLVCEGEEGEEVESSGNLLRAGWATSVFKWA